MRNDMLEFSFKKTDNVALSKLFSQQTDGQIAGHIRNVNEP